MKTTLVCIGMTIQLFSKTVMAKNQKKLKKDFQKLFKGNELDIVIRWPTLYMAYYMLYSRPFMNIN